MTTPIVDVHDLEKTYGKAGERPYTALQNLNFTVAPGEFVGIMGASGSGKTTLLNMLSTLDTPTKGQVVVNGHDVTQMRGNQLSDFRAQEVGFIFQDFNLLESLTAEENIGLPLALTGTPSKVMDQAIHEVATTLSIEDLLKKYPAQLSGGQKQRVAAARAIVHRPALLMGDEPTGALDSTSARELLDLLTTINREQQMSVLLVTHDPFSASFCQRILFIKDGQIGSELTRGELSRQDFYQQVLNALGTFSE
ncbi:ABC transporter ATP-binding protein [Levilactobacillus suantsaii]|uniref:ABC transporter ATP-binding protein n=1 Tax=Levilactobacillus suantsaii TaxID=2292255 RepID=A0A4Q0VF89_9LACO|nr:ABC transporter ATP-binding protein [Levilactobacillus suantsaii]QMU09015.1 ABC transporter ATP-binding protein [Levilactobacillus suantsaii]RXI76112.1 ABC transporter ATP-binding protein [Levilactobacillus suantsaii]